MKLFYYFILIMLIGCNGSTKTETLDSIVNDSTEVEKQLEEVSNQLDRDTLSDIERERLRIEQERLGIEQERLRRAEEQRRTEVAQRLAEEKRRQELCSSQSKSCKTFCGQDYNRCVKRVNMDGFNRIDFNNCESDFKGCFYKCDEKRNNCLLR